ncbi:serine hydrolase domain-containing protein [Actinomarinicola tropica]|uniref:Serine hydrolase n=1 Tax=Actinomarinicola tropica TaxID=2789776 RepID=A0A5Q2RHW4_9ACTN|nr:serine hydrolase domain-containing protein [Actinomarinicola tropica]QGG95403.1 serine hydrolase [Actinomarinicola tropica]
MPGPPRAPEIRIPRAPGADDALCRPSDLDVDGLTVPGTGATAGDVLRRWGGRSLVVASLDGAAREWRAPGIDPARPQRCFSLTKSLTGVLAARAVDEGLLDRTRQVSAVIPALDGTGVGSATVGDVADMTVSIAYDEDYEATAGAGEAERSFRDFGDYVVALGFAPPGVAVDPTAPRSVRAFVGALAQGEGPHGHVFQYATPIAELLVWILETSVGRGWIDLLRDWVWEPSGARDAAAVQIDPEGVPTGGGGLAATTRDLARVGLALAAGRLLPGPVLDRIAIGGDPDAFRRSRYAKLEGYTYRDQWWIPGPPGRILSGWGIHGQVLWVDLDHGAVVVIHSGGGDASDLARDAKQEALCRTLVAAVGRGR